MPNIKGPTLAFEDMPTDRKPDAVLVPEAYVHQQPDQYHRLQAIQVEFGAKELLNGICQVASEGNPRFVRVDGSQEMGYPANHPSKAKMPRYAWYDRGKGDGVLYGFLKE